MSDTRTQETMSEAFDEMHDSPLVETDFGRLAEKVLSRRGFLSGGAALAASAFVMSTGVLRPLSALANGNRLGFEAVAANGLACHRSQGIRLACGGEMGHPMWSRTTTKTRGTGASQDLAFAKQRRHGDVQPSRP